MISQEVQKMVEAKAAGAYSSPDEVVIKALKALEYAEIQHAELKAEIKKGIDELEAGLGTIFNADEFLAEAKARRQSLN
jgi:Arc/MetJ-type ribon-helix-helix transcriptional regulator